MYHVAIMVIFLKWCRIDCVHLRQKRYYVSQFKKSSFILNMIEEAIDSKLIKNVGEEFFKRSIAGWKQYFGEELFNKARKSWI